MFHPRDAAKVNVLRLSVAQRKASCVETSGSAELGCPVRPEPDALHTTPRSENGKYSGVFILIFFPACQKREPGFLQVSVVVGRPIHQFKTEILSLEQKPQGGVKRKRSRQEGFVSAELCVPPAHLQESSV